MPPTEVLADATPHGPGAGIYDAVNQAVLSSIPAAAHSILDVGCGSGALGSALKRRGPCRVAGITYGAAEAEAARRVLDDVILFDLDDAELPPMGPFDVIVCSHVLEHLKQPERLLAALAPRLQPGGELVVALPNALYWRQRLQFLRGRFRYTDGGLMDRTHLRFFDVHSAAELLQAGGWHVLGAFAEGGLPGSRWLPGPLRRAADRMATRRWPGLFGHQVVLRATRGGR